MKRPFLCRVGIHYAETHNTHTEIKIKGVLCDCWKTVCKECGAVISEEIERAPQAELEFSSHYAAKALRCVERYERQAMLSREAAVNLSGYSIGSSVCALTLRSPIGYWPLIIMSVTALVAAIRFRRVFSKNATLWLERREAWLDLKTMNETR